MKTILLTALSTALLTAFAPGEMRDWKSANGKSTLRGDLLNRDDSSITLRKADGRVVTFSIEKLHSSDQDYLKEKHPLQPTAAGAAEPEGDAFGPLRFGDSRKEVEEKLLASSIVKTDVDTTLFGRTGLNGIFETSESIGGLHCSLYFDWTSSGTLEEVTLRTKAVEGSSYNSLLQSTWEELISLLSKIYGNPISKAPFPKSNELQDGLLLGSHLWRTNEGFSVLLGTAQEGSRYNVSVRITARRIRPIPTP